MWLASYLKGATLFEHHPDSAALAGSRDLNGKLLAKIHVSRKATIFSRVVGNALSSSTHTSHEHNSYHPESALDQKPELMFYFEFSSESVLTDADTNRCRYENVCVADPHVNAPAEPKGVNKRNSSKCETNPDSRHWVRLLFCRSAQVEAQANTDPWVEAQLCLSILGHEDDRSTFTSAEHQVRAGID